jgi:hypothetical protein
MGKLPACHRMCGDMCSELEKLRSSRTTDDIIGISSVPNDRELFKRRKDEHNRFIFHQSNQITTSHHITKHKPQTITMSFLSEATFRRVATLQLPRTLASSAPRAAFSTSIQLNKTATETAKDALKTVDRAVSDKLVDGINVASKF